MNKYIFWSVMMCAIFFNASSVFADRFIVEYKQHATKTLLEIEKLGFKVKDVRNLDQEVHGNVLIVFE
jgi:hypothetical protein